MDEDHFWRCTPRKFTELIDKHFEYVQIFQKFSFGSPDDGISDAEHNTNAFDALVGL